VWTQRLLVVWPTVGRHCVIWTCDSQNQAKGPVHRLSCSQPCTSSCPVRFNNTLTIYRVGQKNDPTCFCQNFIKSLPNLPFFNTQMAKTIELCEVHSVSTSSNLCQCTTVYNADAPNCYIMQRLSVSDSSPSIINSTECHVI